MSEQEPSYGYLKKLYYSTVQRFYSQLKDGEMSPHKMLMVLVESERGPGIANVDADSMFSFFGGDPVKAMAEIGKILHRYKLTPLGAVLVAPVVYRIASNEEVREADHDANKLLNEAGIGAVDIEAVYYRGDDRRAITVIPTKDNDDGTLSLAEPRGSELPEDFLPFISIADFDTLASDMRFYSDVAEQAAAGYVGSESVLKNLFRGFAEASVFKSAETEQNPQTDEDLIDLRNINFN